MSERKEHINIIYPEEGKRYRLNVRTAVGRLTVGKVKQCLAAASSCPIPLEAMVLHLNGVPLSDDRDVCESLGIGNGATLSVEARVPPPPQSGEVVKRLDNSSYAHHSRGSSPPPPPPSSLSSPSAPFALSEQRRLLELQTLEQQDAMLHKDVVVRDEILRSTLHHVDDEMDQANLRRRQLERQRENAEEELRRMHEKEAVAAQERQRLAKLRAQEAARATERAAQLAERREQLRAEQEATRAIALLKLENEKKKAALAQQKALLEAERERALLEQDSFEATTKARELELRSREIDMEHQRLARIREARALDADRRLAVQQRLHYYERLGVEPPRALQREAAMLLMHHHSSSSSSDDDAHDDDENTLVDHNGVGRGKEVEGRGTRRHTSSAAGRRAASTKANGLVQSRGPSHASPPSSSAVAQPPSSHSPIREREGASSTQPVNSPSAPRAVVGGEANDNGTVVVVPEGGFYDARENAEANLRRLGDDLGLSDGLQFDDSDTCVLSIDGEYTLLVTYDAATERLYLYSTLLATLPPVVQNTAEGRLRLYEFLLEASLLGREMCGGGVGASMRNSFVLMSASLYMPTSQPWSLRTLAPQFLHCLQYWRVKLTEFLATLEREGVGATTAAASTATTPGAHPLAFPPPSASFSPSAAADAAAASSPAPRVSTSPPTGGGAAAAFPSWSAAAAPVPPPPPQYIDPNSVYGASPSRSHAGSLSPSQSPPQNVTGSPKVVPVLGLEVTGTVLVNGMPTHYDNGVLVVNAAGPSVLAGIQPNDFVEELNGVAIRSVQDFRRVIAEQLTPGMLVPVRVNRGGVAMIVTVRVEAAWSL
jgi:membrane protein involved in colicin uptake